MFCFSGWHVTLYILAAIFGLLNYTFLQSTSHLFDDHCILFPRKLEFHMIKLPENATIINNNIVNITNIDEDEIKDSNHTDTLQTMNETETIENKQNTSGNDSTRRKRDTENDLTINNITIISSKC